MSEPARSDFRAGVASGVAASAVAVLVWLATQADDMRAMLRDFAAEPPALTSVALHPLVSFGVPAVLALALGYLARPGGRRPGGLIVLAVVGVAAVCAMKMAIELPFTQLAGNISAG